MEASAAAFAAVETGSAQGLLAAHAITMIAAVDGDVILEALQSHGPDFEDAVTAAAARQAGCDYIVTRDPTGFRASPVRSLTPEALVSILAGP